MLARWRALLCRPLARDEWPLTRARWGVEVIALGFYARGQLLRSGIGQRGARELAGDGEAGDENGIMRIGVARRTRWCSFCDGRR